MSFYINRGRKLVELVYSVTNVISRKNPDFFKVTDVEQAVADELHLNGPAAAKA